jgi:hypothetical protein
MVSMITRVRGQFEDLAYTAHGYIHELLQSKLDDLMSSLVFVNWTADKMPTAANDAVLGKLHPYSSRFYSSICAHAFIYSLL